MNTHRETANFLSIAFVPLLFLLLSGCAGMQLALEPRLTSVHNTMTAMGLAQTGSIQRGSLSSEETARLQVELEGGNCYTFLALGASGVEDLNLAIGRASEEALHSDDTQGPEAAMQFCPRNSGPYTVTVGMAQGSGGYAFTYWSGGSSAGNAAAASCTDVPALTAGETTRGTTSGAPSLMAGSCAGGGAPEQVYALTLETRAHVIVELNSQFDGALYILGQCGRQDTEKACNDDDSGSTNKSRVATTLEPGTYYVVVDGYQNASGEFELTATVNEMQSLSELCEEAELLTLGEEVRGLTVGQPDNFRANCGNEANGADRVYRINSPEGGRLRVHQTAAHDGVLHLRRTCEPTADVLMCNDDYNGQSESILTGVLEPGDHYLITDGYDGGEGEYTLRAEMSPTNGTGNVRGDQCADAPEWTEEATTIDTFEARNDYAGSCGGVDAPDVVRRINVSERSRIRVNATQSEFKGVLYLQRVCGNTNTEIACVALPQGSSENVAGTLDTVVPAGEYALVIDGESVHDFGRVHVSVIVEDTQALARACRSAPLLRSGRTISDTTEGQQDDFQATCADGTKSPDRMYRLRLNRRSRVRVNLTSQYDAALHIRSDCTEPSTEVACNDDHNDDRNISRIETTLDAGTYIVIVDGFGPSNAGEFELEVDISRP